MPWNAQAVDFAGGLRSLLRPLTSVARQSEEHRSTNHCLLNTASSAQVEFMRGEKR